MIKGLKRRSTKTFYKAIYSAEILGAKDRFLGLKRARLIRALKTF